jgi:uncharacterized protein (DUF58 family)
MRRYLTLRHALAVIALVLFLVAWNRGIALLYGMFALVVAVLLVSLLLPRLALRPLSAIREYPTSLSEGESLPVQVRVRNHGWWTRYLLEVVQESPGDSASSSPVLALLPRLKKEQTLLLHVPCEHRGRHELPPLELQTGYPLGISEAAKDLCVGGETVLVYPTPFEIHEFPYVSGAHMPLSGVQAVAMNRGSQEFMEVREYQSGDSPRHIHWPQTARQHTLMVREHEYLAATEVTLLLDLQQAANVGEGRHTTLEYAVKIAASVAQHACAAGHRVRLLGYGAGTLRIPPGGGRQHYEALLTALAEVKADGQVPYEVAVQQALWEVTPGSVMVLFHSPLEGMPAHEPTAFYSRHVKPVWVRFDSHSFRYPIQVGSGASFERIGDIPIYHVQRGDDLAAIFGAAR